MIAADTSVNDRYRSDPANSIAPSLVECVGAQVVPVNSAAVPDVEKSPLTLN